jgi:hypothetical protein
MVKKKNKKVGRPRVANKKQFVTINVSESTKAKWNKLKEQPDQSLDSLLSKAADGALFMKSYGYVIQEIEKRREFNIHSEVGKETFDETFNRVLRTTDACTAETISRVFETNFSKWMFPDLDNERTWVLTPKMRDKVRDNIHTFIVERPENGESNEDSFWNTINNMVNEVVYATTTAYEVRKTK